MATKVAASSPSPSSSSSYRESKDRSVSMNLLNKSTSFYNKQLLRTGAFADCTVTCKGRSWPAHRNILSPRCDFFKCCFDGRFSEGQTRVIAMEDDDPTAFDGMLYYLYTLEYPTETYRTLLGAETGSASDSGIEEEEEDDDDESTRQDAHIYWGFDLLIYNIADKYGLTELRELAEHALLAKADSASKGQQLLKRIDGFVSLIEDLYPVADTSDRLKDIRTRIINLTCEPVSHHVRDQRLFALMADIPEFATELVEALAKKRDESDLVRQQEQNSQEAARARLAHIPMNDESDCEN